MSTNRRTLLKLIPAGLLAALLPRTRSVAAADATSGDSWATVTQWSDGPMDDARLGSLVRRFDGRAPVITAISDDRGDRWYDYTWTVDNRTHGAMLLATADLPRDPDGFAL